MAHDTLRPGLTPEQTIAALVSACDEPDALASAELDAGSRSRLLNSLPRALTPSLVRLLRDALYKRQPLDEVVDFIEEMPLTWDEWEAAVAPPPDEDA